MWINDRPLASFGLEPNTSTNRVGGPTGTFVTADIPNSSGAQLIRQELARPRRMTIPVLVHSAFEHTVAGSFRDRVDDVQDALSGALEVRFDDDPDHMFFCFLEDFRTLGAEAPEFRATSREFEMILVAVDPFRYDHLAATVGEGAVPVGTGSNRIITIIAGPATDPTEIVLKDFLGRIQQRLEIEDTLADGESFVIRHNNFRVDKFTGVDVKVAAIDSVNQDAFLHGYFDVGPALADRRAGLYPRIEVVQGGGILSNNFRRGWK